jgi:hypothetical protein
MGISGNQRTMSTLILDEAQNQGRAFRPTHISNSANSRQNRILAGVEVLSDTCPHMSHWPRQSHGTHGTSLGLHRTHAERRGTCPGTWWGSSWTSRRSCFYYFFRASLGTPCGLWDTGGTACAVAWIVMSVTGGAPWRLVPRGYGLAGLTGLDAVLTAK